MRAAPIAVPLTAVLLLGACGGEPPQPPSRSPSAVRSTTAPAPTLPPERLADLVAYDHARPLDVTVRGTTREPTTGVTVTDLTYDGGSGEPVEAYLITPVRSPTRTLAGVVFAHGSGRDRSRFLDEAKAVARRGALVLLPTVPMNLSGDAAIDIAYVSRAVIAQRRALDVLAARPEVDRGRLGFVGHSWGAILGAILAGAEPRLAAVVVASFTKPVSRYFGSTPQYREQIAVLDQHWWLALHGNRRVLLQAGSLDSYHRGADTDTLFAAISGRKERRDYHLGHDLVEPPEPVNDRREFLTRVLGLART
jgi:dipeptidyl aminopeptidase/acylaminoacyl peptidase